MGFQVQEKKKDLLRSLNARGVYSQDYNRENIVMVAIESRFGAEVAILGSGCCLLFLVPFDDAFEPDPP